MKGMREETLQRLKELDPIDASSVKEWATSNKGREVFRQIVVESPARIQRSPRRRPRRLMVTISAASVLTVAISVIFLSGGRNGEQASAAEVLNDAARVAAKQKPASVPNDGYRYTRSEDAFLSMSVVDDVEVTALVRHEREIWIAPDGSGRLLVTTSQPEFLGPDDEKKWEAAGRPKLAEPGTSDESFVPAPSDRPSQPGKGGLFYQDFSGYSTDPDVLYEQIRAEAHGHGSSTDSEMLVLVGDLLRETVAPPELRAALYRVAARIPGVELVGRVTDPAGRDGIAVARTSDDSGYLERNELIFDPDTSELLAERRVLLERVDWVDAEPGTDIGYAVYIESGVVDSTSERP